MASFEQQQPQEMTEQIEDGLRHMLNGAEILTQTKGLVTREKARHMRAALTGWIVGLVVAFVVFLICLIFLIRPDYYEPNVAAFVFLIIFAILAGLTLIAASVSISYIVVGKALVEDQVSGVADAFSRAAKNIRADEYEESDPQQQKYSE